MFSCLKTQQTNLHTAKFYLFKSGCLIKCLIFIGYVGIFKRLKQCLILLFSVLNVVMHSVAHINCEKVHIGFGCFAIAVDNCVKVVLENTVCPSP